MGGCQLCGFIWTALGQSECPVDGELGSEGLRYVSEKYPGREISLAAWGGECPASFIDRVLIATSGEISETYADGELVDGPEDPSMHPDHQTALSGVLDIFAYPDDAAAWHGGITGRPLPTSAGDSETDFEFVKLCLDDCLSSHTVCCTVSDTYLPTRILHVGDNSREPYLLESKGVQGRYATLSHCWGGHVPLTTTIVNLSTHKDAIPMASLPLTFRQAVRICRELGIQYLWIDSLCILQDSKADWEKESVKMADVYGNSYLTIAARGAKTAEDGCFFARKIASPCRLEYRSLDGTVTGNMYFADPASPIERMTDTPLDQRGWVLQERILSPRIAYYGTEQIYWECRQCTRRQDEKFYVIQQDKALPSRFKQALDPHASLQTIFRGFYENPQADWSDRELVVACRMNQWYMLIEEFSQRKLTVESDRLPALAGIAKVFAKSTGCVYVAGMWREHAITGLLWYRSGASRGSPTCPNLPSWSWARFKGRIHFWNGGRDGRVHSIQDNDCEVIGLSYCHTGLMSNYGEVSDAKLTLRGRIIPADCRMVPYYDMSPRMVMFDAQERSMGTVTFDIVDPDYRPVKVFCLLARSKLYRSVGLVLERMSYNSAMYKRVGFVNMHYATDCRSWYGHVQPCVLDLI
ncbi:hypothetical protein PT974_04353 [Cladobotryum mycophilum]|uniref:Heterokaryon incompatibility domain-containing protein n=1 Tax=Cladobotryum mycophilum TaxID=491253 RepID=A0ABR0SUW5_9HYPO